MLCLLQRKLIIRLKKHKCCSLILAFTAFTIVLFVTIGSDDKIISKNDHVNNQYYIKTHVNSVSKRQKHGQEEEVLTRDNHEWIINQNVIQYSSILVALSDEKYKIESFILVEQRVITSNMRCLIRNRDGELFVFRATEVYLNNYRLKDGKIYYGKCVCEFKAIGLTNHIVADSIEAVAIAEIENFVKLKADDFMFQRLEYIKASITKKAAVVHCLKRADLSTDHELSSLRKWLSLQKRLGYRQVTIYLFRSFPGYDRKLISEYGDFIKLVYHENVNNICRLQKVLYESNTNSDLLHRNYNKCRQIAQQYLNIESDDLIDLHETISANDCYMSYRHVYQIVTDFGLNELIIPNDLANEPTLYPIENCVSNSLLESFSFDIFNYYNKLFDKIAKQNTLSLKFHTAVTIEFSDKLDTFIKHLENLISAQSSFPISILYSDGSDQIQFEIAENEIEYAKHIISNYNYAKCYIKNFPSDSKYNFYKFFTIISPIKIGAFIYNTYLTEFLNEYDSELTNENSVTVPSNYGFLTKFKTNYLDDKINNLNNVYVNINYLFLLKQLTY